jgi:hypothetical protein
MVRLGAPYIVCHAPSMARQSKLPKALQPMLATLIDAPFDVRDWVFESNGTAFALLLRSRSASSPSTRAMG